MKIKIKVILICSIISLIACEKNDEPIIDNSDYLIGFWVNPVSLNDTVISYSRSSSLNSNDYSFAFKSDQVFIERKNAGWCGTPPIAYEDYNGSWTKTDSNIKITVGYWGGLVDYQWKIVSLDKNSLSIYRISEELQN